MTLKLFDLHIDKTRKGNDLVLTLINGFGKYAIAFLEQNLQLFLNRKSAFIGSKCMFNAGKFIKLSTTISCTMQKLKPFINMILVDTILPMMFILKKDVETFETNPIEYIRNQYFDFKETLFYQKDQV